MGKVIIIIHPAELLRRGLSAVLEDLHMVRIFSFSAFAEISFDEFPTATKLMLIVPVTCKFTDELLRLRTNVADHELIGLETSKNETVRKEVFDHILPFNVSAEAVKKLAEDFFEQAEEDNNDELTNREREVLRLIALGNTNKSIAETLFISTHTVISHRKNITEKLGIKSIPGLTVYAIIQKIIDPVDISPDQLS